FPWVYSGPIGAILTPQFQGVSREPELPFASSLCGACAEVCPVKIEIPKILLALRAEVQQANAGGGKSRFERLAFRIFAWLMRHPAAYEMAGRMAASLAGSNDGEWLRSLPPMLNIGPIRQWLCERDLPPPPARSFRQLWRQR